ncbi:MAG: DUF305 domain-containing protein [Rubrobacteraceae bacterium]|nr:DUF305 domain-containing protein [Rubrobacteraceae bacterium]
MRSVRRLFAGLALATLLAAGAGAAYAVAQASPVMGGGMMDDRGNGTGSMMSIMGDEDGMGSMMSGGGMMGSFDEDRPFDLQFIDGMTMHHEGAIMSSKHMISDSKRPELRELAEDIEESQSGQIDQMQEWRGEWYPDAGQTSGMPAGMMEGMMEGMMGGSMQEMMGGDATDEMFLRMMIPHHQMAVDMSEKALDEAEHPELENLARKIINEQTAEIELMKGYLEEIEAAEKE